MTKKTTGRTILVLNGPNLNLLGTREPAIYGRATLTDIATATKSRAGELGFQVEFRQSNSESELVSSIQGARTGFAGLIVNAGAYTHTSIAILDALSAVDVPVIEVHLSNIYRRESFRHHSFVSRAATGVIAGLGAKGYELAVEAIANLALAAGGRRRNTAAAKTARSKTAR